MITPRLVSIIIPVFNRETLLREAVSSCLAQTYPNIEILIVDDGSVDNTLQVAQSLALTEPSIVRVFQQANAGPGSARNLGLAHATGEFVQYLDSDDLLEPRKLELQVSALGEHPEAGVAYGLTRRNNLGTGELQDWARTSERITDIFPSFLMKRGWDTNSPLWRRSVCDAVGPWSNLRCMEDWEHDLQAGLLGVIPVQVNEHVVTVRDHVGARASGMHEGFTVDMVRDFFLAHGTIWLQMQRRGLNDWTYLREFSRKVFWIARLCGEHRLTAQANEALAMAEEMVSIQHPPREIQLFRVLTRTIGWSRAVALTESARRQLLAVREALG